MKEFLGRSDNKYDHVVTIEDIGGCEIPKIRSVKKKKKNIRLVDFLFCSLVTVFWVIVFWLFVNTSYTPHNEKFGSSEYLYLSYFVLGVIVGVVSIHFKAATLRGFERYGIKIAVVFRKIQVRKLCILRMRTVGGPQFVETEVNEKRLNLNDILESSLTKTKIPDPRICSDADVKTYRPLEYIEVHCGP